MDIELISNQVVSGKMLAVSGLLLNSYKTIELHFDVDSSKLVETVTVDLSIYLASNDIGSTWHPQRLCGAKFIFPLPQGVPAYISAPVNLFKGKRVKIEIETDKDIQLGLDATILA